jgi:hypothetical protein
MTAPIARYRQFHEIAASQPDNPLSPVLQEALRTLDIIQNGRATGEEEDWSGDAMRRMIDWAVGGMADFADEKVARK